MKKKIVKKAEELFLTLGFKSITMDDIANSMGISKKTIYTHFDNKTKLVEVVTFEALGHIHQGIDNIKETSTNPIEELYQIKMFVMNYLKNEKVSPQFQLKKYYPKIYDLLNIKQFEKMNSCVIDSLKKGVETGLFRAEINLDFISRIYFSGTNGIRDINVFPDNLFDKHYIFESYLEYHLRAIVTSKGLKLLNDYLNPNQTNNVT